MWKKMVVSKFKIGDEVETNEKYKQMAEEHNEFMNKLGITNSYTFPTYRRGKVTEFHEEDFNSVKMDQETKFLISLPFKKGTDIIVHIDDFPKFEHSLNQDFLQKVQEWKSENW